MLILALVVFGFFVGWIAQLIVGRGAGPIDWIQSLVAGLVGSFIGGLVISLISGDGLSIRPSGILGSIGGAIVVLLDLERGPALVPPEAERRRPEDQALGQAPLVAAPSAPTRAACVPRNRDDVSNPWLTWHGLARGGA